MAAATTARGAEVRGTGRITRHSTETRRSLATSEFWVMIAASVVIMLSAYTDRAFDIKQGWTLVAAIVIAYIVSRGIAKAGSREPYIRAED